VHRDDFVAAVRRVGRPAPGATPTALVVDDDPAMLEVMGGYLSAEGYRVQSASNGREAVSRALAAPPDVMVLDLLMPGMNGFEVIRALRAHPAGRNVPIVVCTAKQLTPEERADLQTSVQSVVAKADGKDALLGELARAGLHPAGA
jgi:CheY-like chemotaxis protein